MMRAAAVMVLVTLQILLPAPGCWSSSDSWQQEERDSTAVKEKLAPAELCSMIRCQRLRDVAKRDACNEKCLTFDNEPGMNRDAAGEDDTGCLREKCAGLQTTELRECAFRYCGLELRTRRLLPPIRRLAAKRMQGLWPDEFETRMAERAMWPDEYETRNVKRSNSIQDDERELPTVDDIHDAQEDDALRRLVRRVRSEDRHDTNTNQMDNVIHKSVQKRWSTRLCMESHCKNAHSKIQYFTCGKNFCHR